MFEQNEILPCTAISIIIECVIYNITLEAQRLPLENEHVTIHCFRVFWNVISSTRYFTTSSSPSISHRFPSAEAFTISISRTKTKPKFPNIVNECCALALWMYDGYHWKMSIYGNHIQKRKKYTWMQNHRNHRHPLSIDDDDYDYVVNLCDFALIIVLPALVEDTRHAPTKHTGGEQWFRAVLSTFHFQSAQQISVHFLQPTMFLTIFQLLCLWIQRAVVLFAIYLFPAHRFGFRSVNKWNLHFIFYFYFFFGRHRLRFGRWMEPIYHNIVW